MNPTADPQHMAEIVDALKDRLGGDEPARNAEPTVTGGAWQSAPEPTRAHPHRRPMSVPSAMLRLCRRKDVRIAAAGVALAGFTIGLFQI